MNRRRRDKSNPNATNASEAIAGVGRDILIDGYNLLHCTRFEPPARATPAQFQRCRAALLDFLVAQMPVEAFPQTTVVFDANNGPPNRDTAIAWRQLHVIFAREHNSADDLIIDTVRAHHRPTHLTVVSSDHRVQVACGRRGAQTVDSPIWFDALLEVAEQDPLAEYEEESEPDRATEKEGLDLDNPFPPDYFDDLSLDDDA